MGDLAAAVEGHLPRWGADHVAVAVRIGEAEPVLVGDVDHRFRLASITKLITAVAALVAVEEGALALADPAGPPGSTVEHLLAHASGLGFDGSEPLSPPGRRRIYSNAGYEALAERVTDATGIAFATYVEEAVVAPLGLAVDTSGSPAAGFVATAPAVLGFLDQVRRPTVLAEETMARAVTVAFPGLAGVLPGVGRFDPLDWGHGFEVRGTKSPHWTGTHNSPRTVGHFGGAGTFAWHDPAVGVTCVGLGDREFGDWALQVWPKLSDLVLTNGV